MPDLVPDCSACSALCCVALAFSRSSSFAFGKASGTPCHHLDGSSCSIYASLLDVGMSGCVTYECFGAGQRVTQQVYAGASWRSPGVDAAEVFAVFDVVRRLHEFLVLLPAGSPLAARIDALADGAAAELRAVDVLAVQAEVGEELRAHSLAVRGPGGPSYAGSDLVGRDLRSTDLARADLRGALLIAADLRGAVLDRTDLLGADLRDARLAGADLSTALFLTQPQLNAARGDRATVLPEALRRPVAWSL